MTITGLILVVGAVAVALSFSHKTTTSSSRNKSSSTNTSSYNTKPAPSADNSQSQGTKTSPQGATNTGSTPSNPKNPTPGAPTYSVQIVNASLTNNNTNLHVGTLVSGTTTGDCTLTATQNNGSPISLATSTVKEDVNNYDCGVYNVPVSKFPSSGAWKLTLTVTNNGESATASQNVSIP